MDERLFSAPVALSAKGDQDFQCHELITSSEKTKKERRAKTARRSSRL
jgi:hypothetical protein